jgi:RNA polymerase sigma factor (sigma-70 family)
MDAATDPVRSALTTPYVRTLLQIKARRLSHRPEFRRADPADVEHDLIVHVLRQASRYDPARGAVTTFVARVVETAAAMLIRERKRLKRAAGHGAISLEQTGPRDDRRRAALGDVVVEDDLRRRCGGRTRNEKRDAELSADVARALETLTPRQREIAKRLTRAAEASVAREMDISRRQVRKAVEAIRKRFEEAGLTEI